MVTALQAIFFSLVKYKAWFLTHTLGPSFPGYFQVCAGGLWGSASTTAAITSPGLTEGLSCSLGLIEPGFEAWKFSFCCFFWGGRAQAAETPSVAALVAHPLAVALAGMGRGDLRRRRFRRSSGAMLVEKWSHSERAIRRFHRMAFISVVVKTA